MDVSQDEDPNLLWTTDTEGLNINQFNRRGQDVDAIVNENTVENWSDASVSRIYREICKFWKKHEAHYRATWKRMNRTTRRNMIRIVCPTLPESISNPTFTMSGETHSVHGAVLTIPAPLSNVADLIEGENLPNELTRLTSNPVSEVWATFTHHIKENAKDFVKFDPREVSDHFSGKLAKYHVFIEADESKGDITCFELNRPEDKRDVKGFEAREMKSIFEGYLGCRGYEWKVISTCVSNTIITLATICDEYRVVVLKKSVPYKITLDHMTCWQCKKEASSTVKLSRCGKCSLATYCSRECQLLHWKAGHKTECKKGVASHTKTNH